MAEGPGPGDKPLRKRDTTLTETNLLRELRTVTDWFPLGLLLSVPQDALLTIQQQHSAEGLHRVKGEMISQYLNTGQASWKHVIAALRDIGRNALADRLEAKYIRVRDGTKSLEELLDEVAESSCFARQNSRMINLKFASLVRRAYHSLQVRNTHLGELKRYVSEALESNTLAMSDIDAAATIQELFRLILKHGLCSYLHYDFLESIIQEFAEGDESLQSMLEDYQHQLSGFELSMLLEHYITYFQPESDELKQEANEDLPKFDPGPEWISSAKITEQSLEYVYKLWKRSSSFVSLPPLNPILSSLFPPSVSSISLQDPVSAGSLEREKDTADSGVGITQTQDSSGPSSVKVGALYGHLESAIAGDSQTHSEVHPRFRGVHTLSGSPWHVSVTSEAKKIQWDEIGVLFNIPEGAVPPGKVLNLTVWPCIKGPFVPPPGYHFASPVFIVGPEFRFDKKILFQLSHFIQLQSSDDCENMVFLSARSTSLSSKDGNMGYRFKVLEGGTFEVGQPVGTISLNHFCAVAAGKKINAGGKVHYSVQLHHSDEAKKAIFIVSIVDKVYTKNVKDFLEEQYPGATFQPFIKQPVEFAAENEVTLHIPNPADSMSGWVILSDINPCKISREEVDFPLLHSEAPCQIPDYPPKLPLSLEQSHPPQRPFHQCSLSVGGLMQPLGFMLVLRKSKHPGPPSALLLFSQQPGKGNTTVRRLSYDDLHPVLKELVTACAAEWENIGLELKLLPGTLDAMKGPQKPPKDCLRDMLKTWLNTSPDPSWQDLIEALRSPLVGQDALARELESKYCF